MKHKAKSLLITLLTALMIMTMLPATAFAASKKSAVESQRNESYCIYQCSYCELEESI